MEKVTVSGIVIELKEMGFIAKTIPFQCNRCGVENEICQGSPFLKKIKPLSCFQCGNRTFTELTPHGENCIRVQKGQLLVSDGLPYPYRDIKKIKFRIYENQVNRLNKSQQTTLTGKLLIETYPKLIRNLFKRLILDVEDINT